MEEKKYSQIAFEFDAGALPAPAPETADARQEDIPVNVGVRIKALKQAATESDVIEFSAPVVQEPPVQKLQKLKSTRGRKSLKEADAEAKLIDIPPDEALFSRQYYSIGEVAAMFHVNTSLIRFWEREFDILQPRKNRKGDRHFRPVDIKNLLLIHDLLRRRKMTIEGARSFLKQNSRARERFEMIDSLRRLQGFLLELKASL